MRRRYWSGRSLAIALSALLAISNLGRESGGTRALAMPAPRAAGETVACRVLEAHTSEREGMTVVIFHQRNKSDGPRLGEMIRVLDGKSVRFEKADAKIHTATLFRLKSCFGRGMLLFPASSAQLVAGDEFELQVPAK